MDQLGVQIFATDVDEDAIEFARHGIYPAAALAGVSQKRLARYFIKLDVNYQVTKSLRGMVIFGVHDLGLRAPFPHIDLVLCRNVLMYFTKELQTRALQLFAFSLRTGGYLALGSAETTSPLPEYFTQLSPPLRLYRRHGDRILAPMPTGESLQELVAGMPRVRPRPPSYAITRARAALKSQPRQVTPLQHARTSHEQLGLVVLGLPVGVVVIDRHYDIQIINGPAMRLLGIFTEAVGEDLIHLAQSVPSAALRAVIDAAFAGITGPIQPPELLQQRESSADVGESQEGVLTIQTLLGEQHSLQFFCYPYVQPLEGEVADEMPEHRDVAAEAPGQAGTTVPRKTSDVPLVLILIRDVTEVVRTRQETARVAAQRQAESQGARDRLQTELEKAAEQLQSENARLKAEVARQVGINRTLVEGNQKLAATNLALRATNENLQLSEEEAEASTEEVKTLNEELQATNEELVTLNEELEATVEELHAANDELQARAREVQEMAAKLETRNQGTSE